MKWEYFILSESLQEAGEKTWWEWADTGKTIQEQPLKSRLNELGREGWELVSVSSNQTDGTTYHYTYYFKRPAE